MAAQSLQRPLTVKFTKRNIPKVTESEIVEGLREIINIEDIKAVQITPYECRVTLTSDDTKEKVKNEGINIGNVHVLAQDADTSVTNVTVKDAPVEMEDRLITTKLSQFGQIVQGSMRRGKIKNTEIENGTRYLQLLNVQDVVPSEIEVGSYTLRVFCDNGKTQCIHCTMVDHPSYRCPAKRIRNTEQRTCNNCFSVGHMAYECTNEIVCRHCGQSGHKQYDCEEWKESRWFESGRRQMVPGYNRYRRYQTADTVRDEQQDEVFFTESVRQKSTLLIGDSVIGAMKAGKSNVSIHAESGARIADMNRLAHTDITPDSVSEVVVHLGINDVFDDEVEMEDVYIETNQQIQKLKHQYQGKPLILSSVLPIKGQNKAGNTRVKQYNHYLQRLCQTETDTHYQNNEGLVMNKGQINETLYRKKDGKGVHLNDDGLKLLAQHIGRTVKIIRDQTEQREGERKRGRSNESSTPPSAHLKGVKHNRIG